MDNDTKESTPSSEAWVLDETLHIPKPSSEHTSGMTKFDKPRKHFLHTNEFAKAKFI